MNIKGILPNWLKESNRWGHLKGVYVISLLGTALMGIGCIGGMEFKDCHHSHGNASKPIREYDWSAWDWLDVAAGAIGCLLAVLTHALVALLVYLVFFKQA